MFSAAAISESDPIRRQSSEQAELLEAQRAGDKFNRNETVLRPPELGIAAQGHRRDGAAVRDGLLADPA